MSCPSQCDLGLVLSFLPVSPVTVPESMGILQSGSHLYPSLQLDKGQEGMGGGYPCCHDRGLMVKAFPVILIPLSGTLIGGGSLLPSCRD
jgi:hypothetical protein